jgi:hypothetical protein
MDKVYDLKGSTFNRTSRRKDGSLKSSVLKDLDWIQDKNRFKLDARTKANITDA